MLLQCRLCTGQESFEAAQELSSLLASPRVLHALASLIIQGQCLPVLLSLLHYLLLTPDVFSHAAHCASAGQPSSPRNSTSNARHGSVPPYALNSDQHRPHSTDGDRNSLAVDQGAAGLRAVLCEELGPVLAGLVRGRHALSTAAHQSLVGVCQAAVLQPDGAQWLLQSGLPLDLMDSSRGPRARQAGALDAMISQSELDACYVPLGGNSMWANVRPCIFWSRLKVFSWAYGPGSDGT